jgi:hypothetical protein
MRTRTNITVRPPKKTGVKWKNTVGKFVVGLGGKFAVFELMYLIAGVYVVVAFFSRKSFFVNDVVIFNVKNKVQKFSILIF